ncbi:MAG: alpha-galactosidase [Candidatus Hydrogenedentes bacterium]|nr:alpha-galactosidase [Candidatus Hydrogenedentota bacterium]
MLRVLLPLIMMSALSPQGTVSSPAEIDAATAWIQSHIEEQAKDWPFSFSCDGISSRELLGDWEVHRTVAESSDGLKREYTVELSDPRTGVRCNYSATAYPKYGAVELILRMTNAGKDDSPLIEDILPLDLRLPLPGWPCTVHHMLGDLNSAESFKPLSEILAPDKRHEFSAAPKGGRSSDEQMPFFNLQWPGGGMVMAIGWAGQWKSWFSCEEGQAICVRAGMERTRLRLHPGESIRTPRILIQFWEGDDDLRGNNLFRHWMLAHNLPKRDGAPVFAPICGTVAETAPDGSYEEPHVRVPPSLAERGIEVFWSDMDPQQWYPIGFPEGTGTWEPDPAKYPNGLGPVGKAVDDAGLKYLLWFEPERVAKDTSIDRDHPEWLLKGDPFHLFRLDLPEARAWITDYLDKQITDADVDWLRWDFNVRPLEYWRKNDARDRQGMTEIRHVEGLYAMWEDLMQRHPGLLIDICASGGRRLDFETLRYGLPLWHSDRQCFGPDPMADQLQNGGLYRWVPLHGCGVFGLEPSYLFRSGMTSGNILCLSAYGPENEEGVRKSVALQKELRPFMLGDFYPLFPHIADEGVWYGYQFHRPDLDAGFAIVFRRKAAPYPSAEIQLQGLDPARAYAVRIERESNAGTHSGTELQSWTVNIPEKEQSMLLRYGP